MKTATLITMLIVIAPTMAVADGPGTKAPPAPWSQQDPAVSLYRDARAQLNDNNYERAAELFERIIERYPRSTYTPDAYYWRGFALYKNDDLKDALSVLKQQQSKYPNASTASETKKLITRINGVLASQGDSKAGEDISKQVTKAAQGCPRGDDDDDIRIAALNSFLNMNSEQAIPLLKQILARRDACSVELRRKAVFLVSQKRGAEVEDILLGAARNDPDKEVRAQAVFWLSQVPSERAVGYLEDILKSSNDNDIREKALFALSQHRSERAGQLLRSYAENTSAPADLREKAIFWLGQRRAGENTEFLKALYGKERNQDLREKIIFSLSQQRGNESWLMAIATNENENIEMRKKALFWAGQSKGVSLAELTGLYERMGNREMKDQLIFVYSQRRDKEAVDKLMSISKNEQDRELRKKAIFWLSQSKDPRVAEFLMQLINQ
jgi:tetratricopeptide (TPR) repeat protein